MPKKLLRNRLIGALGSASLAVCGAALAAPTLVGTTTNASGIDGVVVDSVTYDVTFSTSSFDSTFSTILGAYDAAHALANDLQTLSVTGLSNGGTSGVDCTAVAICIIWAGSSTALEATSFDQSWGNGTTASDVSPGCPGNFTGPQTFTRTIVCLEAAHWTNVTAAGVPEPATLGLMVLGLLGGAGAGFAGRKHRN